MVHTVKTLGESWVLAERVQSQVQAAVMGFLRRVHFVALRNKVRNCEIRKALKVEPLLLIARCQLVKILSSLSALPSSIKMNKKYLAALACNQFLFQYDRRYETT